MLFKTFIFVFASNLDVSSSSLCFVEHSSSFVVVVLFVGATEGNVVAVKDLLTVLPCS